MKDLFAVVQKNHFTISAFNIESGQLLRVVMRKVKEPNSPVILEMSLDEFNLVGGAQIQAMIYETAQTDVSVCTHLDHGDSYETAVHAIHANVISAMVDTSTLPHEESVTITKKIVETAHIANVSVESELGTIGTAGSPIEGGTQGVTYTVPEETKQFTEDTRIDALAVAIGITHGIYPEDMKPEPCINALKDIINKVDVPLILHGGSSDENEEIVAAVDNDVRKISISSDIKVVFYTQYRKTLNENPGYYEPLGIYLEVVEVCGKVVEEKIRLFKSSGKVKYYYQDQR